MFLILFKSFHMLTSNHEFLNSLSDKLQTANRTVVLEKKREREEIEERVMCLEATLNSRKKFEADAM